MILYQKIHYYLNLLESHYLIVVVAVVNQNIFLKHNYHNIIYIQLIIIIIMTD